MKRVCWPFLALVTLFSVNALSAVYEEEFASGQAYPTGQPQFDNWVSFTGELSSGVWRSVTLSGSNDLTGLSCNDQTVATQIAAALADTSTENASFSCEGNTWNVGLCSIGTEPGTPRALGVNLGECSCGAGYAIRPAIGNTNWGGVGTATCDGPTQTMRLEFTEGELRAVPTLPQYWLYALLALVAGLAAVAFRRQRAVFRDSN
ncbi:MAG: hypothetical protein NXH81_07860 [Halieaceae bacterium]|uniref:hypothetical protein n=1 Tax=Haliea alexandrii TaxID=2448162 RepID=UPI001304F58F|nr:hypothetical protein [Haliea alexandrii]MCR9185293.1 hypothetical protein [Halieaceae bacterium]